MAGNDIPTAKSQQGYRQATMGLGQPFAAVPCPATTSPYQAGTKESHH